MVRPLGAQSHARAVRQPEPATFRLGIDRRLKSVDVIDALSDLFMLRGVPEHVRSDNGPEFIAKAVQDDL